MTAPSASSFSADDVRNWFDKRTIKSKDMNDEVAIFKLQIIILDEQQIGECSVFYTQK